MCTGAGFRVQQARSPLLFRPEFPTARYGTVHEESTFLLRPSISESTSTNLKTLHWHLVAREQGTLRAGPPGDSESTPEPLLHVIQQIGWPKTSFRNTCSTRRAPALFTWPVSRYTRPPEMGSTSCK